MAVADEIRRVHGRIDKLDATMGDRHKQLLVAVTEIVATCKICRPIVLGDGKDAMDIRVDRLEMAAGRRRSWFWFLVGAVVSLGSAVIGGALANGFGNQL